MRKSTLLLLAIFVGLALSAAIIGLNLYHFASNGTQLVRVNRITGAVQKYDFQGGDWYLVGPNNPYVPSKADASADQPAPFDPEAFLAKPIPKP